MESENDENTKKKEIEIGVLRSAGSAKSGAPPIYPRGVAGTGGQGARRGVRRPVPIEGSPPGGRPGGEGRAGGLGQVPWAGTFRFFPPGTPPEVLARARARFSTPLGRRGAAGGRGREG